MAEKKQQHYVPRFLLRYWGTDEDKEIRDRKIINIFNSDTLFYKKGCPLYSQAKDDYFYGKDLVIENALGDLEGKAAAIISDIVNNLRTPQYGTDDNKHLFLFSMLMAFRTKEAAETTNEMLNKVFQKIKELDSRFSNEEFKDVKVGLKNPAAYTLASAAKDIYGAYDLEMKLIYNTTPIDFIISDNPAIRYNQFLEKRNYFGGHIGLFNKGLQIFVPITPKLMLVYFDKWAYKIGNKKDKLIIIDNVTDVERLNYLQIINCHQMAFSNNNVNEHYLKTLANKAISIRNRDKTTLFEANRETNKDGTENILFTQHRNDRKVKLNLGFIKLSQAAKSHKFNDFAVQVRQEHMRYAFD